MILYPGRCRFSLFSSSLILTLALVCVHTITKAQAASDAELNSVRHHDNATRNPNGKLAELSAAEHVRRANIYMTNRAFAEAREHWQALIDAYPNDVNVPAALFGMGRSYYQERRYNEARRLFERVAREYPQTKEGREGLNFSASSLLRMGGAAEAVERYREYIDRYPEGERIDTAYLNVIDGLRDAGRPREAIAWIDRTREKFAGTATDTNALFARLRLDIGEGEWRHAAQTADGLLGKSPQSDVMTSADEVSYLKAYCLEHLGRTQDAISIYLAIPDKADSYFGALATERLSLMSDAAARRRAAERAQGAAAAIAAARAQYPLVYRLQILRAAKSRGLDPRMLLSVMKQESRFHPQVKSPAAARGLLQLTIDTAERYAARAGVNHLTEAQLYRPEISIAIGSEYLAELNRLFPNLPEAVIASYNGGEDNVSRWLKRAKGRDVGVFTAEVGFAETKGYVFEVMANYRAYRQLYTAGLRAQARVVGQFEEVARASRPWITRKMRVPQSK